MDDLARHLDPVDRLQAQRLALLTAAALDADLAARLLKHARTQSLPAEKVPAARHRAWARARAMLRAALPRQRDRHTTADTTDIPDVTSTRTRQTTPTDSTCRSPR